MVARTPDPIALVSPDLPLPRSLLEAPGGFFWWYLDLLDAEGTGMVVIWSFGLPFLPGYGAAARRGQPQLPGSRPSLNVAVYERGAPASYLLQELSAADVEWTDDRSWRFGESHFRREGDTLSIALRARLPGGGRLEGDVRVQGSTCRPCPEVTHSAEEGSEHGWTPLLVPAFGEADLDIGDGRRLRFSGRAYHDRNHSTVPLGALGIEEWFWGRAHHGDEERVIYWLKGPGGEKTLALRLGPGGGVELLRDATLTLEPDGRARYGMPRYRGFTAKVAGEPFMDLGVARPLDDGPFYLRSLLEERATGEARGFCEVVVPARVDLDLHRPFVRMRVHHLGGENSWFLPFLAGPRRGRLGRFARHLIGADRV